MDSDRYYVGLKYSVIAAIAVSFIWVFFITLITLPDFNNFIFVLLIGVPVVSMFISLICTVLIIIPSVILLKKINLDKKIPVVIIGIIVGVLLWYLSTVEVKALFMVVLYAVTCSYAFMVGYDKYKKNDKIE